MITVGIASIPGREDSLRKTLDSLTGQVDDIQLVLNYGATPIPEFLNRYNNCWWYVQPNKGDAAKFAMCHAVKGYYFSCDDDLIYPPHYVSYMICKCKEYKSIVTLHGKKYGDERPIKSFRKNIKVNVRCLNSWDNDVEVDVGGTGAMCFHTDFFEVALSDLKYENMADLQVSLLAKQKGVKIIAVAHPRNYLQYTKPTGKTIWQMSVNDKIQTEILNQILS